MLALIGYGNGAISLRRFSTRTGRPVDSGRLIGRIAGAQDVIFGTALILAANRRWVVTSSTPGPTMIRDPRTLRPFRRIAMGAEVAS